MALNGPCCVASARIDDLRAAEYGAIVIGFFCATPQYAFFDSK